MVSYLCPCCGALGEQFAHQRSQAPATMDCGSVSFSDPEIRRERVERTITNPDGTQSIVIEEVEVELAPVMSICTGTMTQTETFPGQLYAANARRFEPLVVYERVAESLPAGIDRYYIPGRNNEPTEPGMKRIELTNMAEYNRWVKTANEHETAKMRDHREMHRLYWDARRGAMRDDVNARIRHSPFLKMLARLVRARSDRKTDARYGKPLDAHFHAQLLEFNQSNMQDWSAEDSGGRHGWQARRAK